MKIGSHIGPYELIEALGEGGMGVVYRARQSAPISREVALKLVKAGMDTKQVLARFEAERQALAVMDHPGIAKVHDAGETDTGRPYFVMELVEGEPVTTYCDHHTIPLEQRLELFVSICQAVQHAHQKGIIHRDLKPSNILVSECDGRLTPRIIDFGIAKATGQSLTDATMVTNYAQLLGTPAYMSPEQADLSGLDVDTRTDIYALGTLLYELVTGKLPIAKETLEMAAFAEVQRLLWEEDPPPPSKRLTSMHQDLEDVSRTLATTPHRLVERVRGDLDWIVMKAIHKDRTQRYETASSFADDIGRFLEDHPVLATPPSRRYHLRKFIRRHRTEVMVGAIAALLLASAAGVSTWLAIRAKQAEQREVVERLRAETQATIAEETLGFFQKEVFAQANPEIEPDREIKLKTVLDRAAKKLEGRFVNQPRVRASLLRTLGKTYGSLGDFETSAAYESEALALLREDGDTKSPLYWRLLRDEALRPMDHRDYAAGIRNLEEVLLKQEKALGGEHLIVAETRSLLGRNCEGYGKYEDAVRYLDGAIATYRALGEDRVVRALEGDKGVALVGLGRIDEALELLLEVRDYHETRGSLGEYDGWFCLQSIGKAYFAKRDLEGAEKALTQALTIGEKLVGIDHPRHLTGLRNLGVLADARGDMDAAYAHFKDCYDRARRVLGVGHGQTLMHHESVAKALENLGRNEDSLTEWFKLMRERLRISHHSHDQAGRGYIAMTRQFEVLNQPERLARFDQEIANRQPWPDSETTLLLPKGAEWQRLSNKPTINWANAVDPLDQAWATAQAPFGFGEPEVVTSLNAEPVAHYFRRAVLVEPSTYKNTRIAIRADDAFALYVNGDEIARRYLPERAATNHLTRALHKAGGFEERLYYHYEIPPDRWRQGQNVIAVEIHQYNASSSDLFFDLFVEARRSSESTRQE